MTTVHPWRLRPMRPEELGALYCGHIRLDFPSTERPSLAAMRHHIAKGLQEIVMLHDGKSDTAYAALAEANEIVLVTLLAVFADSRGDGRGTALLALLKERYAGKRAILLEVEDPEDAADAAEHSVRARRIAFYQRAGYALLHGVSHTCFGVRLLVMALPLTDSASALRESAVRDMQAVYHRILPAFLWARVVTKDCAEGQASKHQRAPR